VAPPNDFGLQSPSSVNTCPTAASMVMPRESRCVRAGGDVPGEDLGYVIDGSVHSQLKRMICHRWGSSALDVWSDHSPQTASSHSIRSHPRPARHASRVGLRSVGRAALLTCVVVAGQSSGQGDGATRLSAAMTPTVAGRLAIRWCQRRSPRAVDDVRPAGRMGSPTPAEGAPLIHKSQTRQRDRGELCPSTTAVDRYLG
jgi:hypothetical protein